MGEQLIYFPVDFEMPDKVPQTGWLTRKVLSHSSAGWKSEIKVLGG